MKNNKAFTLIEVLVVSLIAGIVGMGVITSIAQSNRILNETVEQTMANNNIQLVMNDIARDVKEGVALQGDNWTLTIVMPDTTKRRVWTLNYDNGDWTPKRIDEAGGVRHYKMFGTKENNKYRQFLPYFYVNKNTQNTSLPSIGKYHKVDVHMSYIDQNMNYNDWSAQSVFYCKQVAKYYGF